MLMWRATSCPITSPRQKLVFGLRQKIFVAHPGLLPHVLVKFVRVGDTRLPLQIRHVLADVGIYVDVQLFALLNQQQFVNPIAQNVLLRFCNLLSQLEPRRALRL